MKNNKTLYQSMVVLFILCLILAGHSPSPAGAEDISVNVFFSTLQLLREEYIEELDANQLLKGALDGMKSYLELKGLKTQSLTDPVDMSRTPEANMRAFYSIYENVVRDNRGKINENELIYGAMAGMTKAIQKNFNDPYTVSLTPEEYKILQEQLNSVGFSGIGIFIELDKNNDNALIVVEPIEGSPAEKAGMKAGDQIIRINGVSTKGMGLDAASNRIRGLENTPVVIHVKRNDKVIEMKILRDMIQVSSLTYKMIDDLGYIKLRFFGETTHQEINEALDNLEKQGAKGFVLDLRNNGGGYIVAAVQICSQFVDPNTIVTSVVNYRKDSTDVQKAFDSKRIHLPLAILVNKFSASASEITAGCIQENNVGIVVGEKTFGKGSVQTINQLPGGGAIKFTSAHYLTPKGRDINKKGIDPDITVTMEPSDIGSEKDVQLKTAISQLKKKTSGNKTPKV